MSSTTLSPVDIEALIVARLVERLKDAGLVKFVYDTREYGAVEEESQLVPALVVIYNGYRNVSQIGHGSVQSIGLDYLVVVVTRNSRQSLRASGAKEEASGLFTATIQALIGWKPDRGVKALLLADGPAASYSDAGTSYLPIAFTTQITYTPQP